MQQPVESSPAPPCAVAAGGRLTHLADLDALAAGDLGVFFFADVRPLMGVAGLLDWHLGGQLSRALSSGALSGMAQEQTLMATDGRLGRRRLFCFGLGIATAWQPGLGAAAAAAAAQAIERAGGKHWAALAPVVPHRAQVEAEFVAAARRCLAATVPILCC